jgi:hypothetical protein
MNGEERWEGSYFNYFTEVEEHFQRARGTGLFLLSPLDWALIESWKDGGVPLEAALAGIDDAFEKWRGKKSKIEKVNSLAYCAQAVLAAAQAMAGNAPAAAAKTAAAPFELDDLRAYLAHNAATVRRAAKPPFEEIAAALDRIGAEAAEHYQHLEDLERRLTSLEDKMIAAARTLESEEDVLAGRREFDLQLRPYRSKMSAEQIAMLERQFLERRLLESYGLPRLSLFYLR